MTDSDAVIYAASDVGGTFTDLVYFSAGKDGQVDAMRSCKVHTTSPEFERGVFESIQSSGIDPANFAFFAHGSTVVINALTERKGAKTALITTRGFRDVLEIARGDRPDFFNLRYKKPTPFVPRYLRAEITERLDHTGAVRTGVALDELDDVIELFQKEGVEAIAVCFLHAYANPNHEQLVTAAIKQKWPDVPVVASHQITREWREYERTNTAVLSAYVQPVAQKYLEKLEQKLLSEKFAGSMYVMQSNGGIDTLSTVKAKPITMVESGPASGMLGAAMLGRMIGVPDIIALDIGGTTAKCSLIDQGAVRITNQYMIEQSPLKSGYPIMTPVVDIVEIGNGGGSIAWVDPDEKLHVGPKSAGALPGPVAYGKGGTQPTTTDANLMLGRINPDYFVGGEIVADMNEVGLSFDSLGAKLGISATDAARGVVRIANNNMVNALKLVSINRGYDTRDFTLVAFGGGGAMHATSLAIELNIPRIIIPAHSAVFSAWGMLMSDLRRDFIQTRPMSFDAKSLLDVELAFSELEAEATAAFEEDKISSAGVRFERRANMRYEGQEHTVQVLLPAEIDESAIETLTEHFHATYEREYTYHLENRIEVVGFHLTAYGVVDRPSLAMVPEKDGDYLRAKKGERDVDFDDDSVINTVILDRDQLGAGDSWVGPSIVEEAGSTAVIHPNQKCRVDEYGNIHIELK